MFRGSITALITPFRNGALDKKAFEAFVDWQIKSGTNGLVPVGTTGESPVLSHEEHGEVVEICIRTAAGRVPVMAGAGSNSTEEALEMTRHAEKAGANGILSVAPYYNKPNQEGLFQHFAAIARATSLPVFIYNIPGRSIIDVLPETLKRLHDACPNVVGVKDATANVARTSKQREVLGPDFIQLSGEDISALGFNAHGGVGCISVSANVAPKQVSEFQAAMAKGDYATALEYQDKLAPLHKALFIEPNPAGVKYAASRLGLCENELRLPLVPVSAETAKAIDAAMEHAGLVPA